MLPILEIKNISKKFRIQHEQQPYLSLRDSISKVIKSPLSFGRGVGAEVEDFWALKDVSFNVYPGESIGIIGKNGAGKSTLLKILSKITPPTSGKIISRGRIASLLEVGTGFHPELSGRENIFLNGSILGMKRKEIQKRFDEIVDFSGVEKFLDTPLKHYSSGMQLRLAFAVAAFLEPEILVIDEVLAVGDAEFQQKCLGKMEDVSKSGRTVLFVSHNMGAVKTLCRKSVLLNKGCLIKYDNTNIVVNDYSNSFTNNKQAFDIDYTKIRSGIGYAKKISIEDIMGNPIQIIPIGQPWQVRISFTINDITPHFIIGIGFKNNENISFRTTWSIPKDILPGEYEAIFKESTIYYGAGKYKLNIGLSSREHAFHYIEDCAVIEFDGYADKNIFIRSGGLVLNQMEIIINKI
ncbi:MAG: ABC transporter ATP-binding protein [Bacteroidetes bacterium]|nr:ABC transporter ATP-binding protein [Bacteroidota bacterium]